jgi:hypothetical protein
MGGNDNGLAAGFNNVCDASEMIVVGVSSDDRENLGRKVYTDTTKVLQSRDLAAPLVSA